MCMKFSDIPKEFIMECIALRDNILTSSSLKSRSKNFNKQLLEDADFYVKFQHYGVVPRSTSSLLNSDWNLLIWFTKFPEFLKEQQTSRETGGVECPICGFVSHDLNSHITRGHRISKDEMKSRFPDFKYSSDRRNTQRSVAICGEKNPAKSHGGKLSAYSRNFKGYIGLTEYEIDSKINELYNKKMSTVKANPHNNPKRVEYYLHRGQSEKSARSSLSSSQSTFSLEKCVEKYGEDEGRLIWENRQFRWMNSFLDKSEEELSEIYAKRTLYSCPSIMFEKSSSTTGIFYIVSSSNDCSFKFGISKRSVQARYSKKLLSGEFVVFEESKRLPVDIILMVEAILKGKFFKEIVKSKNCHSSELGWTESLLCEHLKNFLEEYRNLLNTPRENLIHMYSDTLNRYPTFLKYSPKVESTSSEIF